MKHNTFKTIMAIIGVMALGIFAVMLLDTAKPVKAASTAAEVPFSTYMHCHSGLMFLTTHANGKMSTVQVWDHIYGLTAPVKCK